MSESSPADFIELDDHWRSITRRDHNARGVGKWILGSADPHRLYQILREEMLSGVLLEVISMKTKKERAKGEGGGVYLYACPYTDTEKLLRVAEELRELDGVHDFQLGRPLIFKTDLHNTWEFTLSKPGDGYHELLKKNNWIYKYQDGELVVNAAIQALHQAMEDPLENADPEFLIIRSLLPEKLFASSNIGK